MELVNQISQKIILQQDQIDLLNLQNILEKTLHNNLKIKQNLMLEIFLLKKSKYE